MIKTIFLIAGYTAVGFVSHCASSKDSAREIKNSQGKVVGRYEQIDENTSRAVWDQNHDGKSEKIATYSKNALVRVDYFDPITGVPTKSVGVKDGKPNIVQVYDQDGKTIRGVAAIDQVDNIIREVELPQKNKTVKFNTDGSASVVE